MNEAEDRTPTKGERTRARLLEEALRLFALKGHEAVGTRELAAAAGVNIAAIAFHFGGKAGLYDAVVTQVAGELARVYRRVFDEAGGESDAAGEVGARRVSRIIAGLAAALLTSNRSQWMSLLLQREFITPSDSFEKIYTAIEPAMTAIAGLVGEATGLAARTMDNKVLAFSLFIMASAFARNKTTFQRFAGTTGYTAQDVDTIARTLAAFAENGLSRRS